MVDLADSKNQWVVLDADSDALIRFSIFTYLEVLFPPGSWRTFLVNGKMQNKFRDNDNFSIVHWLLRFMLVPMV